MKDPVDRAIRAIAARNSFLLLWLQFAGAHIVLAGGIILLRLFEPMTDAHFWTLIGVSQGLGVMDNVLSIKFTRAIWRPVREWEWGRRDPGSTVAAWQALATLPLEFFRRTWKYPLLLGYIPFVVYSTLLLGLGLDGLGILAMVGTSVLACGVVVRYFAMEIVCRPVIERVAAQLPPDFDFVMSGPPLRWRIFTAVPVINIVTALIVVGLARHDGRPSLEALGLDWALAIIVSLTLSLELLVLVMRSLGTTMRDVREAIARVQAGDFTARVPVVSTDETGRLAQSFNRMVEGLGERARLHDALGAYVDPIVADRILREGNALEGEEIDATILFLDVRDFTVFAETNRPRDVVALLNELWDLVVPVIAQWHGRANKFVGDGLLAVFGTPEPLADHAYAATRAALEIADRVRARYGESIGVGIGVNTGQVIVGTVGGGGRVEFTVIGDAVNTASRVEAMTRETGDTVLITEATRVELPADEFVFEPREHGAVKGKRIPVQVWRPELPIIVRETRESTADRAAQLQD